MLTLSLMFCCSGCAKAIMTGEPTPPTASVEVQTYRVEYVDESKRELARGKVGSGSLGTEIVERPLVVAGYTPKEQELRATLKAGENLVLRFYYEVIETSTSMAGTPPMSVDTQSPWKPLLFIGGMAALLFFVSMRVGKKWTKK